MGGKNVCLDQGAFKALSPPKSVNFEAFLLICTVFPHFGPFWVGGVKPNLWTRILWTPRLSELRVHVPGSLLSSKRAGKPKNHSPKLRPKSGLFIIDRLTGLFRGAVFHHDRRPENSPLTFMVDGPFSDLDGPFPRMPY